MKSSNRSRKKKTAFAARFGNGEEAMFLLVVLDADRLLDQTLSGKYWLIRYKPVSHGGLLACLPLFL
jgi:hypothetical protein